MKHTPGKNHGTPKIKQPPAEQAVWFPLQSSAKHSSDHRDYKCGYEFTGVLKTVQEKSVASP